MSTFEGYNINLEKSDDKGMLNAKSTINYSSKAMKTICKINLPNGFGSGFFCRIPYTENKMLLLPVLLTNNHVISKNYLNSNSEINIDINGDNKQILLKERKIWTDENMDFTCIEIKEEDKINSFYNLDDNILDENYSNDYYLNQKVLIFAINKDDKEVGFSNGLIKKNLDEKFAYTCNTLPGCSGGSIVNQSNNCIIGIHRGEIETGNKKAVNQGIYIWNVIKNIKDSKEILIQNVSYYFNNLL